VSQDVIRHHSYFETKSFVEKKIFQSENEMFLVSSVKDKVYQLYSNFTKNSPILNKTKEKMKYYDRFPLVIPIEKYKDGFLGLNLHYIHPKQRIILLDKLSATASNKSFDENTKLRISYAYLAAAAKAFEANPCIKRYLFSHVQSRFLEITANEWDIAVMLPVESFVGATTSKVYSDSRKKF
jgi:hypothetical protein